MSDNREQEDLEFWTNLDRYIVKLQDEDKAARRATLKTIYTAVQHVDTFRPPYKLDNDPGAQGENSAMASVNVVETQLAAFIRPILCCCKIDASEKCREISYDILGEIFDRLCSQRGAEQLPIVIPQLRSKFGSCEINETCEEVRLAAYRFILRMLKNIPEHIDPCVSDLVPICANGLTDSFVDIRIETCSIICAIAQYGKQNFYNLAHHLTAPMSETMNHAQQRVRKAVISCIGPVLLHAHFRCFEALFHPLALRVFDHIPEVRLAFIEVIGTLMLEYNDRYSCFHKLIPLLFSGFHDASFPVAELAKSYWIRVGDKFLSENGEEYKNEIDFPLLVARAGGVLLPPPTVGCKILASQNIGKLLPAIKNEIAEWQLSFRQKSIQLLYSLMYNCEEKLTMHVNEILNCLVVGALDENVTVTEYVDKSAELLGRYVQFPIIWSLLKHEIEQVSNGGRHYAALRISAGVIRNANPYELGSYRKDVGLLIYHKSICQTREERKQLALVEVCAALLSPQHVIGVNEIDHELFHVLMTVSALTTSTQLMKKVAELTRILMSELRLPTVEEFLGLYFRPILRELKLTSGHWTRESPDKLLFELICEHGGLAAQENWDEILDIMVTNLAPDKDPKVRLDLFTKLSVQLSENKVKSDKNQPKFDKLLHSVVKDVLGPNLVWRAGETASALRVAALGTLHAALEGKFISNKTLDPIAVQMFENLLPMLEESMEIARMMTCQVIQLLMKACGDLGVEVLHKVYPALIKRMDDSSVKVRISACEGLKALFLNTSKDYGTQFAGHLQYVFSVLLLHLDDDDEGYQKVVSEILNVIGQRNPKIMIEECEKIRDKLRTPVQCNELIQKFQNLTAGKGEPSETD